MLGYDGSYLSLNVNYAEGGIGEAINYVPEIFVTGKKSEGFGEGSYNGLLMYSKFTGALGKFTYNQNSSILSNAVENTKVGRSVSAAENFLFLELPGSLAGGELLAAGWRAAGAGKYLGRAYSYITKGGPTFSEYKALRGGTQTLDYILTTNKAGSPVYQRISIDFSHTFITQSMQKSYNLPNWMVNNSLNVWKLNTIQHALIDSYRFRFLRAGLKQEVGWFGKYNWFTKFP